MLPALRHAGVVERHEGRQGRARGGGEKENGECAHGISLRTDT